LSDKEGGRKRPFKSGYKPQFFFRVSNVTGTVYLEDNVDLAMPGENLTIRVEFITKAILSEGLRFVMREGNLTIGAGLIISLIE
jgi:elongation factor Tu